MKCKREGCERPESDTDLAYCSSMCNIADLEALVWYLMNEAEQFIELESWLESEIHGAWSHDQDTREGTLLSVLNKIKKLKEG